MTIDNNINNPQISVVNPQLRAGNTQPNVTPTPAGPEIVTKPIIRDVAKRALQELVIGAIFAGITACFMVSPLGIGMLFVTVAATVLFNVIIRSIPVYFQIKIDKLQACGVLDKKSSEHLAVLEKRLKTSLKVVKIVCPMAYTMIDMNTRSLLTHEAGHALVSLALYKHASPVITLHPQGNNGWNPLWLFSGETTYYNQDLTSAGESLGRNASGAITAGAGAGFGVIFSIFFLIYSKKIEKQNPELSRYFLASSISTIMQHVFYALSALWASSANHFHDFVQVWAGGVHPAVSAIAIALPLIVRGGMWLYEDYSKGYVKLCVKQYMST